MNDTIKLDDETLKIIRNLTRMAAEAARQEDWDNCTKYLDEARIEIWKRIDAEIQEISPFDLPDVTATIEKAKP